MEAQDADAADTRIFTLLGPFRRTQAFLDVILGRRVRGTRTTDGSIIENKWDNVFVRDRRAVDNIGDPQDPAE